jgi:spore germination cell wall hydrolase CwlJ-like protein
VAATDSFVFKLMAEAAEWRGREIACASMLLLGASCVPLEAQEAPPGLGEPISAETKTASAPAAPQPPAAIVAVLPEAEPVEMQPVAPTEAFRINAAIPLAGGANPAAATLAFRASGLDQLRALQCLAEAVYYEARSESEAGQRAVAQVVLNRVRHPAYPGSVCGVVYQGPMRAGGGCQFTFTCDGSLAHSPSGPGWLAARRIAAEALAGKVYAPVGHSTHYHTHQVVPSWAFKLAKSAVIGSHNFYRLQGGWGAPSAFVQRYAGREPSPATIMATRLPVNLGRAAAPGLPLVAPLKFDTASAVSYPAAASLAAPAATPVNDRLPQSRVKPEFENSGRWLID